MIDELNLTLNQFVRIGGKDGLLDVVSERTLPQLAKINKQIKSQIGGTSKLNSQVPDTTSSQFKDSLVTNDTEPEFEPLEQRSMFSQVKGQIVQDSQQSDRQLLVMTKLIHTILGLHRSNTQDVNTVIQKVEKPLSALEQKKLSIQERIKARKSMVEEGNSKQKD